LGGTGSGRESIGVRPLVDDMPSILVGDLYAKGRAILSGAVERSWRRPTGEVQMVTMLAFGDRVECVVTRLLPGHGRGPESKFVVRVSWTPCNYGGRRAWLHCAGEGCSRRSSRLYVAGRSLLCRLCVSGRYRSQVLEPFARRRARFKAIQARLAPPPSGRLLPAKRKGMHWKTYERLLDELFSLQDENLRDERERLRRIRSKHPDDFARDPHEVEPVGGDGVVFEFAAERLERELRRNRKTRTSAATRVSRESFASGSSTLGI
jgi:hypothetical protein